MRQNKISKVLFLAAIILSLLLSFDRCAVAEEVQAFKVPSGAMLPTLIEGDRILVDKTIYEKSEPKRGDIVVFRYPPDTKKSFVKRVVGLPGETIEIREGQLYINGDVIREPEILTEIYYYNGGAFGKKGQVVKIPDDSYYVLGDSSASSLDSRYWGFVPEKNLEGKAYKIYSPVNRAGPVK